MEKLRSNFEKLNSKFQSHREKFKRIIDKWFEQEKVDLYKEGLRLLQEVDTLAKEITEALASSKLDKNVLKAKIKIFKKTYKKLRDLTKPVWRQWIEAIVVAGVLVFVLRTYIFGLYHVPTGSAEKTILVGDRIWGNKMAYYLSNVERGDSVIFDNPEEILDYSSPINYFWQRYVGFPIPILGLGGGPDNWVKRVIAIPGDVVEGRIEEGKTVIYRNGEKIDEISYVNPYPLIKLIKTTGFVDLDYFGPFRVPSFLRKISKPVDYTYDPEKSFSDQPFYNMTEEEVARRPDYSLMLKYPYSPTYEFGDFYHEFGPSIDSFGPIRIPEGKYWVMGDSRKNSKDSRYWGFLDKDLIHGRASFIIYSIDSEEPFWLFELIKHPIDFWTKSVRWNRFFKGLNRGYALNPSIHQPSADTQDER